MALSSSGSWVSLLLESVRNSGKYPALLFHSFCCLQFLNESICICERVVNYNLNTHAHTHRHWKKKKTFYKQECVAMLLAAVEALIPSVRPILSVTVPATLPSTVNIDKPIMSWSWSIQDNLLNHTTLNQRSWHCVKWPSAIVCSLFAHKI